MIVHLRKRSHNWLYYHHGSAIQWRNSCHRSLTQRLVSWSSPVVTKVQYRSKPKQRWRRVKKGSRRGDPNLSCVFSTLFLLLCVCL